MERRLNDGDWSPSSGGSGVAANGLSSGDGGEHDGLGLGDRSSTGEKDRIIQHLESEVEQQVGLRFSPAII